MKKEKLDLFRKRLLAEKSRVLEQIGQVALSLQQFESDFSEQPPCADASATCKKTWKKSARP